MTEKSRNKFTEPLALLTTDELTELDSNQAITEQAKKLLMVVYDLGADNALELLKWGAHARKITIGLLARQLVEDLIGRVRDREGLTFVERADLRSACDDVLFTAHDRVRPEPPGTPVRRPLG